MQLISTNQTDTHLLVNDDVGSHFKQKELETPDKGSLKTKLKKVAGCLAFSCKWCLIVMYKLAEYNIISLPLLWIVYGFRLKRWIEKKTVKQIQYCLSTINLILSPFTIIFILRTWTFCSNIIYTEKNSDNGNPNEIQSWEYGLVVWWWFVAIFHIFSYIIPFCKYNDIDKEKLWWKKIKKDRKYIKRIILVPFGIDLRKITNIDTTAMDWHVVLVSLLPAVFIAYTMRFVLKESFDLKCGTTEYYKDHKSSVQFGKEYCILISCWHHWYTYYFSNAFSNIIGIWAIIKTLAMFIIKYGNHTCDCYRLYGKDGKHAGGSVQIMDEVTEISKLKQAIIWLRCETSGNQTNSEKLDKLIDEFICV